MWRCVCAVLALAGALADDAEERRSKLPFVADALGNTLPPPSNGPAAVGSPSNLLTPDRYEFYTFDDSGELVKRLMTLEEIQAIVAAGEGTEGHLVTFASDDQPPIAFNFSQAPFTKVHSVVTNVQNVLKAQMEAQKNNPPIHTALDTPDVSDSWSLILPTIFGNTGGDIVPDKSSTAHTVPETEMVELPNPFNDNDDFSKENNNNILSESTLKPVEQKETEQTASTEETQPTTHVEKLSSTTTTTAKPRLSYTTTTTTTTTTTQIPLIASTTTSRPRTTSTKAAIRKPSSTTTTTQKPFSTTTTTTTTTTPRPRATTTTTTTTPRPRATTTTTTSTPRPRLTSPSTTVRPRTTTTVKPLVKSTTSSPKYTTTKLSTKKQPTASTASSTKLNSIQTDKPEQETKTTPSQASNEDTTNNFVPVSTVTRATTEKISETSTNAPKTTPAFSSTSKRYVTMSRTTTTTAMPLTTKTHPVVTTYKPTTAAEVVSTTQKEQEFERIDNATTITTQSISPSTTVSSTQIMTVESRPSQPNNVNQDAPFPFDVALSMSQIASDLGNPVPTTSNMLEMNKVNEMDAESKESLEIEIPTETKNFNETKKDTVADIKNGEASDNFIKISTLDPILNSENKTPINEPSITESKFTLPLETEEPNSNDGTTIDPILFESMDDLLSQVVHQQPTIMKSTEQPTPPKTTLEVTTEKKIETTTPKIKLTTFSTQVKNPIKEPSNDIEQSKDKNIEQNKDKIKSPFQDDKEINEEDKNKTFVQVSTTRNDVKSSVPTQPPVKDNAMNVAKDIEKPVIISDTLSVKKDENNIENIKVDLNQSQAITEPSIKDMNKEDLEKVNVSMKSDDISSTVKHEIKEATTTEAIKLTSTEDIPNGNKENKYAEMSPKIDEFKKKIQKVNIDDKELNERNSSWKLISTVKPPKANEIPTDQIKVDNHFPPESDEAHKDINLDFSKENQGLEVTTKDLNDDIALFTEMCNELAFRYWNEIIEHIDKKRSFVLSPYSITSMLAMMFMGARGATSGEMNDILKLDDMVTFNPHFTLKNISDSIDTTPESGVVVSAFVRELYSDRNIGKILTFYKERAQHFYSGHVEEVNFKLISDIIRRRTNLLVKRHTWGRIAEYMKANSITMQPPLAAFSTNIFQTDCTGSSVDGRDGEMYFVVSPTVRQRRLVPVPAVVYRKGFLAGYDPVLDATAAALGNTNSVVSTLFLMPGQQGNVVHAEDLEALEKRLLDSNPTTPTWNRLLRTLLPRMGLELQIPRFSHKSIFNVSDTLKKMGLKDLFDPQHADLGGLIGPSKDLHLSDMIQLTTFTTCGEGVIADQHHIEEYPERLEGARRRRTSRWTNGWDEPRDYQRAFHDPHDVGDAMHLPLHLRPRQARLPARNAQPARLKFDRPFLFFVRHNPSGMILYVGRYNPRLLP